jgi:hypothetical protein
MEGNKDGGNEKRGKNERNNIKSERISRVVEH